MKRGDIVVAASPGDYGKPRPAVIVQADSFALASLTIAPLTSDLEDAPLLRVLIEANGGNGLQNASQVMIDKIVTVPRAKIRQRVGALDKASMEAIDRALVSFLGLGTAGDVTDGEV